MHVTTALIGYSIGYSIRATTALIGYGIRVTTAMIGYSMGVTTDLMGYSRRVTTALATVWVLVQRISISNNILFNNGLLLLTLPVSCCAFLDCESNVDTCRFCL